ncbi:MAG TPA: permease [Solirubrobacteraceae bacterium]
MLETAWEGLQNALLMAWQVWWALVLGFAISGAVQAWAPRARIERALGGAGARPVALASGLGAASSSCSYAAIAIARSLFAKGASAASSLAFQFASTNLVVELGIVMWVLIGWQFTLAELVGGIVLIATMTLLLRAFISRRLEAEARTHASRVEDGHVHHTAGGIGAEGGLGARLRSMQAWSDVAHNFRNDWAMLYREIALGFLLAGFVGLLGQDVFNSLFVIDAPEPWRLLENVIVGPIVAVLSFVCSVGNIPLAAVLWSGGIGFGGVIAFVFADLIVLPIVLAYRKYYGARYAARIVALMFVTIVIAALIVDGLFGAAGLIPQARPTRAEVFGEVAVDYTLLLNVLATIAFAVLLGLTRRHGVTDPVCGMKVDRTQATVRVRDGRTHWFCSEGCAHSFDADPRDAMRY